jgi:hypothetical protein
VLLPASLQGLVWEDFDDNGGVDLGELAVAGVSIALTGADDRGDVVAMTQPTDAEGIFEFAHLRPGRYAIQETQPTGFVDGREVLGEVIEVAPPVPPVVLGDDGVVDPTTADRFSAIVLVAGASGVNYNFGERVDGGRLSAGQTATIGFWQNKHGQSLIHALNGAENSTILGHWLANTFPHLYGGLAGVTNVGVAETYQQLFKRNGKTSPSGPPKLDAQVLAAALATFATRQSLASLRYAGPGAEPTLDPGLIGGVEAYGFDVTLGGVGSTLVNVGAGGRAFGLADGSHARIIDLLLATDNLSRDGLLYDDDAAGQAGHGEIDDFEALLRGLANDVYSAINGRGGR